MLSYRHVFHAGNHADVLKHFVLVHLLRYLGQKDAPFSYVDTHAGAGLYALDGAYATKSAESETGIVRLWKRKDLPEPLAEYVQLVRGMNAGKKLKLYPGSPWFADALLREQDRLRLFELHPSDCKILKDNVRKLDARGARNKGRGKRVIVEQDDGFSALKALLPPPSRRGLVLIDPPYEVKDDYRRTIEMLTEALKRFATGVYAVWYPQLQRQESKRLSTKLKSLPAKDWLNVTLSVGRLLPDGKGLRSSSMFIINPPWTLQAALNEVMPYLVSVLKQDEGAEFTIEASAP